MQRFLIVLFLTFIEVTRADQRALGYDLVGAWPPFGTYNVNGPIAVKDELAFLPLRDGVRVLDVSTPSDPKEISKIPGSPLRVVARGDFLYVADARAGLQIFSIANPQGPSLISTQVITSEPLSLALAGNYALIGDMVGLYIVDITNPAVPTIAGATNMIAGDIDTNGRYAFVVAGANLQIIDLIDPANLRVVGVYNAPCRRVVVAGDRAYVVTPSGEIHEVDISDLANPKFIRNIGLLNYSDVAVVGNYLYAIGRFVDYEIYDLSGPALFPLSGKTAANEAGGITVSGGHAYIADSTSSLRIVDVRDPANAKYVYYINGWTQNVLANPPYAYITEANDGGFRVLDVTDPTAPKEVGRYGEEGFFFKIARSGNYVYALQNPGGLRVLDVSNPANPHSVTLLPLETTASSIAIDGTHVAISLSNGAFIMVDISNPDSPQIRSTTPGAAIAVEFRSPLVYVMTANSLKIYDVSNPTTPTLLGGEPTVGPNRAIALKDKYAFIVTTGQGLQVIDISNPAAPRHAARLDILSDAYEEFTPQQIMIAGRFAIISSGILGFVFVDVFDPTHPTLAGQFQTASASLSYSAAASGDYLYLAHNVRRFEILKTRELPAAHPTSINRTVAAPRTTTKVAVRGNVAYATTASGVSAFDVSNPTAPTKLMDLGTTASRQLSVTGNLLGAGYSNGKIELFDITNPRSPQKVGGIPVPLTNPVDSSGPVDFKLAGKYAYVLIYSSQYGSQELQVFDLANPADPQKIGEVKKGIYEPIALAVSGNLAAEVTRLGFLLFDVSNPAAPAFRSETVGDFSIYNTAAISGNRLYLGGQQGVDIFDISNPSAPRFLSHYSIPFAYRRTDASEMQIVRNRIYLAYMGLQVIDVSDPLKPTWIGGYAADGSGGLAISGDLAFLTLSGDSSDLEVLRLNIFPTLEILGTGPATTLRWPSTFTGVTVQSATKIEGPWDPVNGQPTESAGNFNLPVEAPASGARFYRLVAP